MTKEFLHKVAEHRANSIFTPEYYAKATDSWYYDELFHFQSLKFGVEQTSPTEEDTENYMDKLYELFYKKYDEYFGDDNAKFAYKGAFNALKNLVEQIAKDKERYKKFEVDESIEKMIESCRTYFLEKYKAYL